jgi:DNA-binding response OmpR family regulator
MSFSILVVEDEEAMRLLLREFLEMLGYQVLEAGDGQTALLAARSGPVALAFLDMNLPDMNGLELMRRLRAAGETFPFVVLSANLRDSFSGEVTQLGVREVLEKPVDLNVLEALVRQILDDGLAAA